MGGEETVTVDTLELPKGGNSDELVSGNLICFSALAGLLAFMLEYLFYWVCPEGKDFTGWWP